MFVQVMVLNYVLEFILVNWRGYFGLWQKDGAYANKIIGNS
jgi:hypothetical protein